MVSLLHRATIKNRDVEKKRSSPVIKSVESVLRPDGSLVGKDFVKEVGLETTICH